ncbi:MAG: reverse transcriptase domain-containing protein [Nanoarchaeota archaeon]
MKTYNYLYEKICSVSNLILAFKKARKGKTKKFYVIEFQKNFNENILKLHEELKNHTYKPEPLKIFILRDPKTRKISKSAFRDRIVHHAICKVIEPIFEKVFIYDSCANRIGKGNLFGLRRFDLFKRKVSGNGRIIKNNFNDKNCIRGYCFKADVRHYFQEVNHDVLVKAISKKVKDTNVIELIKKVLDNGEVEKGVGMPLGNLTSQFFANIYLNELDYFVKHKLNVKYYIRYVDDFVILHNSKKQLESWKKKIGTFLIDKLKLELHIQKSRIISLSRGIDFVGFRNFYFYRLLRRRNQRKIYYKIEDFKQGKISKEKLLESFQGWNAYAKWADSYKLRREVVRKIYASSTG